MKYNPGEKILVRDSNEETWRQRWFIANHPFKDKVVTVDCTGVFSEWFKSNSIKDGSKENSLRGDWEREVKEWYSENEGRSWLYNGSDGSNGSYRIGDAYWWYNNN
tara:strand:+ start:1826 stop:2143 length:318 start_codon:yes stop_codon:yes gene_type:complete